MLSHRLCLCAVILAGCFSPDSKPALVQPAPPPNEPIGAVQDEAAEPEPEPVIAAAAAKIGDPTCEGISTCQGESCCTRIELPAGSYQDTKAGTVHVDAFVLDKYELTVGRVRKWVAAGSPVPSDGEVIGYDASHRPVKWASTFKVQSEDKLKGWERYDTWRVGREDLPKNFIDWYTASAVCHYAGGRLPSDAEWRYAAVGGDENREFPWGSDKQTPERAVYNCLGDGNKSCSLADILPVGSRPLGVGRWGHMDLAGSMFEWTADAPGPDDTVNRGGGFCYIGGMDRRADHVRTTENIRRDPPGTVSHMVGARCAFDSDRATRTAGLSR